MVRLLTQLATQANDYSQAVAVLQPVIVYLRQLQRFCISFMIELTIKMSIRIAQYFSFGAKFVNFVNFTTSFLPIHEPSIDESEWAKFVHLLLPAKTKANFPIHTMVFPVIRCNR
jgi:hypothetical protein